MPETIRQSPLHDRLNSEPLPAADLSAARLGAVGICDVSLLPKLGVKGTGAAGWLAEQWLKVPEEVYASAPLEAGGLIVRLGADEFLIEAGSLDESLAALRERMPGDALHVAPVAREDAGLLLVGPRATEMLLQTCGYEFAKSPDQRFVHTRIAGVSCGVLPQQILGNRGYRIWFDPSYALYLWETLVEIATELGGGMVDAAGMQ